MPGKSRRADLPPDRRGAAAADEADRVPREHRPRAGGGRGALAKALREGWIAGAALDVFEKEPLPDDSPLRDEALLPKLRLFPHAASAARATRLSADPDVGMAGRCVQGAIDVLEGRYGGDPKRMPFVVNKEAF